MPGYERAQLLHVQIKINPVYTSPYCCYLYIGPDRTTVGKLRETFQQTGPEVDFVSSAGL